jgi:hypothetical protein
MLAIVFRGNSFGFNVPPAGGVKILNSSASRKSYPYEDKPYEIIPVATWDPLNGSINPWVSAISRIQRSALIAIA